MIQRAPRWMWIVLIVLVSIPVLVGIAALVPKHRNDDAKAAPAEAIPPAGGLTRVITLPADGSKSKGVYASDFGGKLDWAATGPVGTLVCPDENPCIRLREGAAATEVLRFAREGGGEVAVTLTKSK